MFDRSFKISVAEPETRNAQPPSVHSLTNTADDWSVQSGRNDVRVDQQYEPVDTGRLARIHVGHTALYISTATLNVTILCDRSLWRLTTASGVLSNVISSFHIHARCFAAMMWGKGTDHFHSNQRLRIVVLLAARTETRCDGCLQINDGNKILLICHFRQYEGYAMLPYNKQIVTKDDSLHVTPSI